jgi:hypothetical protein
VARLAAEVVTLRQPATHYPGLHRFFPGATWLWAGIFLLLTAALAVLMFAEPASVFLMVSTVATIALVAAGTGVSALWFRSVLPGSSRTRSARRVRSLQMLRIFRYRCRSGSAFTASAARATPPSARLIAVA